MTDRAILRACFEELLERLVDGGDSLVVVDSPTVEQLNRAAGSLGLRPPIVLRYLKRRPGQGQFWKVSDPATSEIADENDYDAIVADIIDPFSNEEVRRIVIAAGHKNFCEANPDARADLKALLGRWLKFLDSASDTAVPALVPPDVTAARQTAGDRKTVHGQAIALLSTTAGQRDPVELTESGRTPVAAPVYTLGDLIRELENSDLAYAQKKATADRMAAAGRPDAQSSYVQAAAHPLAAGPEADVRYRTNRADLQPPVWDRHHRGEHSPPPGEALRRPPPATPTGCRPAGPMCCRQHHRGCARSLT